MIIRNDNKTILFLAIIAVLLRLALSFFIVDFNNPEMWEFGMIARSLLNGEGYVYLAITKNVTSAFMPPGLPVIYYAFFKLLGDNSLTYHVILIFDAILSGISVMLVYRITSDIFDRITAFYSAVVAVFSPILIYSSTAFNSLIIYQVLLLFSIYFFNRIYFQGNAEKTKKGKNKYAVLLGITLGVFLYFRAEALLFILIITVFFLFKRNFLNAFIICTLSLLIISPWTIRNYVTFGKFIPISTSMGYNFYLGHGDDNSTNIYKERISKLDEDRSFEIKQSEISFDIAFNYMNNHPKEEIIESLNKIRSLWITDYYRDSARNPVYLAFWLPLLLFFITGIYFIFNNKMLRSKTLILNTYFIFSTLLVIVFFNIPRYQIQMSVLIIPVAVFGLVNIFPKLKSFIKL